MRDSFCCRHIECPKYGHRFMWMPDNSWTYYVDRKTREVYSEATCPSCGAHMAVIPNVYEGEPEDSGSIEVHTVRGL